MSKQFAPAAVVLSLLLIGYGVSWPGGLAAMPVPQEETPEAVQQPPSPTLLEKGMELLLS